MERGRRYLAVLVTALVGVALSGPAGGAEREPIKIGYIAPLSGILAQATRELVLAQSSDWQFIISTGAAADYAEQRFAGHCEALDGLLAGLEQGTEPALAEAAALARKLGEVDDPFPDPLPAVLAALEGS